MAQWVLKADGRIIRKPGLPECVLCQYQEPRFQLRIIDQKETQLKKLIFVMAVVFIGYRYFSHHGPLPNTPDQQSGEPSPPLSASEFSTDHPTQGQFANASWSTVSHVEAEAFSAAAQDYHCTAAWRDAVQNAPPGAHIEKAQLPGRAGICSWYCMRIIDANGQESCSLMRAGPRVSSAN